MVNGGRVGSILARVRATVLLSLLVLGGSWLLRKDMVSPQRPDHTPAINLQASFGHLPIGFESNDGQTDPQVKFLAHGIGYGLFLTPTDAVLALPQVHHGSAAPSVFSMRLVNANRNSIVTGINQLPGHSNYFIGNDRLRWHRNIPQYSRVRYRDIYSGIDLDFYGKQGRLEYDFDVHPGADFRKIELDFSGAGNLQIGDNGDLVLAVDGRELRFEAPHIYQESSSRQESVSGNFVLRGNHRVGFEVGAYDPSRTLIIDPVLTFSTYLGGAGQESCTAITGATAGFVPHCPAITVDSAQRVYVAGATTDTTTFPAPAAGAGKIPPLGGASDIFVVRLNASGTALDFTSFIGGSGMDYPTGVGVDSGFNVYLTGTTSSTDYPTTPTGFQATATGTHVFATKLDPTGSVNLYSTYLAGSGTDMASSMAVDSQGIEYIFGTTTSSNFPVTATALQGTALAANQFFFSKINPNVSGPNSLQYSTFIGGSTPAAGVVTGGAIAVDSQFNVYLAGGTDFTDMPLLNAAQGAAGGGLDVWVAKLSAPGNNTQQYTPAFETYFGGSGDDIAYGVASDGTNTYVTGSTNSSNITVPSGVSPIQGALAGGTDAFVIKYGLPVTTGTTQNAVPVSYFTYLGGSGNDVGLAIVADPGVTTTSTTTLGNARVTGLTQSASWANPATQNKFGSGGGTDAFVARVVTTTTTTTATTTANTSNVAFLGGSGTDIGTSIAEDSALNAYVTGETSSGNFPTAAQPGSSPLQSALAGGSDAFVTKFGPNINGLLSFVCNSSVPVSGAGCPSPAPANPTVSPSPVGVGNQVTFVYSIYNQGDPATGGVFTTSVQGTNSTIASTPTLSGGATGTCTLASGSNAMSAVCNLGVINSSSTTTTTSGTTTTSSTGAAATVTVIVNATAPPSTGSIPPKPPDIGNIGNLSFPGTSFVPQTISGSASVNDFGVTAVAVNPPGGVVTAGQTAPYQVTVTPTGPIPEPVTLSVTGLPAGATPSFSNSSIPNLNNGPQSRTLDITTTVRVTTPASLFPRGGPVYAIWLPLSGLALIGSGVSRRRRILLAMAFALLLSAVTLQSACSSSKNTSSTTGTPAGTYTLTINATSGSGTSSSSPIRSTTVQLVVK